MVAVVKKSIRACAMALQQGGVNIWLIASMQQESLWWQQLQFVCPVCRPNVVNEYYNTMMGHGYSLTATSLCRASHFLTSMPAAWGTLSVLYTLHCISDPCKERCVLCATWHPITHTHPLSHPCSHTSTGHTHSRGSSSSSSRFSSDLLGVGQVQEVSCCNGRLGLITPSCHHHFYLVSHSHSARSHAVGYAVQTCDPEKQKAKIIMGV